MKAKPIPLWAGIACWILAPGIKRLVNMEAAFILLLIGTGSFLYAILGRNLFSKKPDSRDTER